MAMVGLLMAFFSRPAAAADFKWPHEGYTYPGYVNPPDWSGNPYYTHQSWDFMAVADGDGNPAPPGGADPEGPSEIVTPYPPQAEYGVAAWVNPYGTPLIIATAPISGYDGENPIHAWEWTDWGMGMETVLYYGHYGGMGSGYVEFQIPNHAGLKKEIWLQYIVYIPRGGPGPAGAAVTSFWTDDDPEGDTATMLSKESEMICDTVGYSGYWHRVTEKWEIEPPSGTIYLRFEALATGGPAVLIDAVDIDTRCISAVATPSFDPPAGAYPSAQDVIISCETEGATIYYTIDGSEPTDSSLEYSAPVTVATTTTLKARAFKADWTPSEIASGDYTITGTIAMPTFSPSSGTEFTSLLDIEISCSTENAIIYYTTDGSEPTESSTDYTSAITITETTMFKAKAFKEGWDPSAVATATYTKTTTGTIATPAFDPTSGSYASAQNVTISCGTEGAMIYYTTDGAEPTESSTEYTGPILIDTTTTLKARAYKTGWDPSNIASGIYTITVAGTVAAPVFSPDSGAIFPSALHVTISCATQGATIYYTTDGTDPTESSTEYAGAITITETTTFNAKAFKAGWDPSAVARATYTKTTPETVAAPAFSPGPGTYDSTQSVTISCDTEEATIYYTTNGDDPTEGSTPYTGPVTISATTILKARAFKAGRDPSNIASGLYTIEEAWSDNAYYTHQGWEFNSLDIDPDTPGWQLPECSEEGKQVAISPGVPGGSAEYAPCENGDPPLSPDKVVDEQSEPYINPYGTPHLIYALIPDRDVGDWTHHSMGGTWMYCGQYGGMGETALVFEIPSPPSPQEGHHTEVRVGWTFFTRQPDETSPSQIGRGYEEDFEHTDWLERIVITDADGIYKISERWEQIEDTTRPDIWWHCVTQVWELADMPSKVYIKVYARTFSNAVLLDRVDIETRCVEGFRPPQVLSTSPDNGATGVKVDSPIFITFTRPMDKEATEGAFSIFPDVGGHHFAWEDIDKTMVFTPEAYLLCDAGYSVTISTDAAAAIEDLNMVDSHTFLFTAEPYTEPAPEVDGLPEGTVATDEATITVGGAGVYRYKYKLDDDIEWSGPFPLSALLTLSGLSDGEHILYFSIEDAHMNWHELDPVTWIVMVPPTVDSTSPGDGKSTPISTKIKVTFSEPMDQESVESAFSIEPPVSGAFSWSGNTLTFAPDESLTADITYTVTIDASASDVAGNSMVSLYSWSFSTYAVAEIRCSDVADTYVLMGGMGGVGYPTRDRLMAAACPMVDARILVKFDLSGLDGVDAEQISKAELCYYMIDRVEGKSMEMEPTAPAGTPMYGFIYVLDNTWSEAEPGTPGYTDWNTKPGYATGAPMVLATHSSGNYSSGSIDVTEIVKGWVRGDYENNGIELKDHDDRCYVDLEHDEGFPWYWASRERDGGQSAPYLSVEIQADCLRITDKPAALPDLSFGETITFEAEGGNGSYAWQVTGPEGGDVTDQALSEKSGSTTVFTAPGTAGIYKITVTDGIDSDSIFVGVRDPDSYTPPQELYDLSQELFPLFMGGQISADDQQGIYGICEKIVSDIGSSGMLREITVINGGPESLVGGTGKSYGASAAIAIIDNPHQASQEVGVVDQNGNTVCKIAITAGDIDAQAGNKIYAVATETGISSWSGASGVYSFALYREDGQKLDNALISNLVITMSFDKNLIVSDELRDGAYSIVFTEGTAQFFTADEEDPKSSVPVSDINEVNYDEGWVEFKVDHLTTFGMGNSSAGAAMTGSKSDEVGGLGGCFITTAGYPDFGK